MTRSKASDYVTLPLVSIITPAYNQASYLEETIQGILNQDYPRIEYIVLNDGSTDNTVDVLTKNTGKLIWESHANIGETLTVNKGWNMAHGELIAVVNSDDLLLPGAVSAIVSFMQLHPDILVAYPDWNIIDEESKVKGHMQVPEYDYQYSIKFHQCIVGPGAFIRRRAIEIAGMRDPAFKYVADYEFWLRLGLYGQFARIPETLASWRDHPQSASQSCGGTEMADEHIRVMHKLYSRSDIPAEVRKVRPVAFSRAHIEAAGTCGGQGQLIIKHCLISFLYHPPTFLAMAKNKWRVGLKAITRDW